jgi:surface antigen
MWFTDDHVAYVEAVADDGTTTISEMNHQGWGIENSRVFAPSDATSHIYIY